MVDRCVRETAEERGVPIPEDLDPTTPLSGREGIFDSIGLVCVIVAVEEAIESGIEQVIMVTALGKRAIEDYFDRSFELEYILEQKGETEMLREMQRLSNMVHICYVRQKEQLGLGHAVLTARDVVGEEPFAVILPDDVIDSQVPALRQML